MSGGQREAPLVPRNGDTVVVGIMARISGCVNQKEMSLDDQVDHGKEVVAELYSGPVEYRIIATKGKGERLDRPELAEIEAELRTRELDLLVLEDLGRLVRGAEANRLLGIGVDHGTRTISPNDSVDTIEPGWEEDALAACRDHVAHNAHASKRIKHKLMNRFKKFGGATALPIYGYIVPDDAETYDDWKRDDEATPFIVEGLKVLKSKQNCCEVADYFNLNGVSVGPYCTNLKWDGKMVRRFYLNRTLAGMPGRGFKHTVKHNESGRRQSVHNPKGPEFYECPHLVHVDLHDLDDVNELLAKRNKNLGRKEINGVDPRLGVPYKRTKFPGGSGQCWYCGGQHVWGGNGITDNLMCGRSRDWLCWNSIGYSGTLAVERVRDVVTTELYKLDGFDQQFRELVRTAGQDVTGDVARRRKQLEQDELAVTKQKQNVQDSMAAFGPVPTVREKLKELEVRERDLARQRRQLDDLGKRELVLPQSVAELRTMLEQQFDKLPVESPEFNDLLRRLVPEFHVYAVRLCDGGHLLPRARVRFALDGIVPDARHVPGLCELLGGVRTLDLFVPPQRELIREVAVEMAACGMGPTAIAKAIPTRMTETPTPTAVQNALALQRKMEELGLSTPYVMLMQPPDDYAKLRRHKNRRYRFQPREGYEPPAL